LILLSTIALFHQARLNNCTWLIKAISATFKEGAERLPLALAWSAAAFSAWVKCFYSYNADASIQVLLG